MNAVLEITITQSQRAIFFEAAALSGFVGEFADRDYVLYLLARDLSPTPGRFDAQRGRLCQRLKETPTPAFWRLAPEPECGQSALQPDGPEHSDGAGGKAPD